MEDIQKIRYLYKLKEVNRNARVKERNESVAEHTWSMMIVADYFLSLIDDSIDKKRVLELILFHDVPEIEVGDTMIDDEEKRKGKQKLEMEAAKKISKKLPELHGERFLSAFIEFEEQKTKESRFAKAMDRMDALIHELDYPKRWKGWSEQKVRKLFGQQAKEFEPVNDAFEEILEYVAKKGYY